MAGALGGFAEIGDIALFAEVGQDLAALAIGVAGLRAGFCEVRSIDIDIAGAGEYGECIVIVAVLLSES